MEKIIGIPIESENGLESKISSHFGKAPFYLLYNASQKTIQIIKNTSHHFGGKGHPPVLLKDAGVHVVLTGGLGDHAQQMFAKFNIEVYCGAGITVKETIELYNSGKMQLASEGGCGGGHNHEDENTHVH